MEPQIFGRYEIKSELGRGGFGTVFHAFDPLFKRDVALKVLPREFLHAPNFRRRFEREAQTVASLEHPAIVPVYDFGEKEGQPYLVMRYLSGGTLHQRLDTGPLPLAEVIRIINRIAPALAEAHGQGIVHRDLKPDNILFDHRRDPYITDFGLVKVTQGEGNVTSGNVILGTPAYMSPEQARGAAHIDGRSDIYSLGIVLFEMLSGQLPYQAETPVGLLMQHLNDPIPRILAVVPDLPPLCEAVIARSLAKDPRERFNSAIELAKALSDSTKRGVTTRPLGLSKAPVPPVSQARAPEAPATVYYDGTTQPDLLESRRKLQQERGRMLKEKQARQIQERVAGLMDDLVTPANHPFALYQLSQIGEPAINILVDALLTHSSRNTRYGAAKALGEICSNYQVKTLAKNRGIKGLIKALEDGEAPVRYYAAESLGKLTGPQAQLAVEPLGLLLKDADSNVRKRARASLEQIGGERAQQLLEGSKGFLGWLKG